MKTEDLIRIKNELVFAINQTFALEGLDAMAGALVLQAALYELIVPNLEHTITERSQRERLSGSAGDDGVLPVEQGTGD